MYLGQKITPEEIITEIIKRTNQDSGMNIWITAPTLDKASIYLERLKSIDPSSLPLWGIPFAIKDNIDVKGIETTAGCPEYAYLPTEHAEIVNRMVAAGAIPQAAWVKRVRYCTRLLKKLCF